MVKGQADKFASAIIRKAIAGEIRTKEAAARLRVTERYLCKLKRSRAGFEYRRLPERLRSEDRNAFTRLPQCCSVPEIGAIAMSVPRAKGGIERIWGRSGRGCAASWDRAA